MAWQKCNKRSKDRHVVRKPPKGQMSKWVHMKRRKEQTVVKCTFHFISQYSSSLQWSEMAQLFYMLNKLKLGLVNDRELPIFWNYFF